MILQILDSVAHWEPTILRFQIGDLESLQLLFLTPFGQWVHASSCSPPYLRFFLEIRKIEELRFFVYLKDNQLI